MTGSVCSMLVMNDCAARYALAGVFFLNIACTPAVNENSMMMTERQITFSPRNHALDNNDNFSPDDRYLCYDTRATVYNENLANCKSIEKVEIATGQETILWEPESVTGEEAAPGVAAVSWHPVADKVIFIHGPLLDEVGERGYYGIRNRTGVEVSADGNGIVTRVDCRTVAVSEATIGGAHRGGTHRHEYTGNGNRVGFTYDDYILPQYDRTIGYMEQNDAAPKGYSHYFAVLLTPAESGKSLSGEIEKAFGDSWVDDKGTMRAFIGKVRAGNGIAYHYDLFVADVPETVDITTAYSGDSASFPRPPKGVSVRRLTTGMKLSGIVRGSNDGRKIAFLADDEAGVKQVYVVDAKSMTNTGSHLQEPLQVSHFNSDAGFIRWHPSGDLIFSVADGNIAVTSIGEKPGQARSVMLTDDAAIRTELVVSNSGTMLAYNIHVPDEEKGRSFSQIFIMEISLSALQKILNS